MLAIGGLPYATRIYVDVLAAVSISTGSMFEGGTAWQ
jgi:hypothetical protein